MYAHKHLSSSCVAQEDLPRVVCALKEIVLRNGSTLCSPLGTNSIFEMWISFSLLRVYS
jgi:hypothetical protein